MGPFWSSVKTPKDEYVTLDSRAHAEVGVRGIPSGIKSMKQVALAGGGVKGLAHLGALEVFLRGDPGFMTRVRGWAGTSAGGILASLLAVGWYLKDLKALVEATDFTTFLDESLAMTFPDWIRDAYLLDHCEGLCSGGAFYEFMGVHIASLTGSKDTTLRELWDARQVHLVLTVTDLRRRRAVHLDHLSHPNLPIRLGARMAMSIPFVFQPVVYDGMICVDGGLLDNMPLHVFDGYSPKATTLGLMLETPGERHTGQGLPVPESPIQPLSTLGSTLIDVWQAEMRRKNFDSKDQKRLVVIPVPDIPVTTFKLDEALKGELPGGYGKSNE
jgi:predicted acylesterase/phospholipase RssA